MRPTRLSAALAICLPLIAPSVQAQPTYLPASGAAGAVLAKVESQLSEPERAELDTFLKSTPHRSREALVDFIVGLQGDDDFRGSFVTQFLESPANDRERVAEFLALLSPSERRLVPGVPETAYSGDWSSLFGFARSNSAAVAKQKVFPDLDALVASAPQRRQPALRDFIARIPEGEERRTFAVELLALDAGERNNVTSFISLLTPAERATAADMFSRDDWKRVFSVLGPADAKRSKDRIFGHCQGVEAGTSCGWAVPLHPTSVTNGDRARKTPWQVEIYQTQWAASHYGAQFMQLEREQYGANRAAWDRVEMCGGVLLPDLWVLTAAHCIVPTDANKPETFLTNRRVRTGTSSLTTGGTTWRIDAVVTHSAYGRPGNGKRDDIALLRIVPDEQTDLSANGEAHPIAIPFANTRVPDGSPVVVSGWGWTATLPVVSSASVVTHPLIKSSNLLEAVLTKVPAATCDSNPNYQLRRRSGHPDDWVLGPGQFCALGKRNQDSCKGDSGGPVVWYDERRVRLVGLVSFGPGCGAEDTPGVYVDVAYYRGWIEEAKKQAVSGNVNHWPDTSSNSAKK